MSIVVLTQVYDEARRLAVAGSAVARGDFRLKKLIPPLEQAGAKAPVFARVAEAAKAVVEGPEEAAAGNLLELTSLVTAVLYTQGETGIPGTLEPVETVDLGATTALTSARLLKPLLEALTSTGSGRLELIKEAHDRGAFRDLRLVRAALDGLDDPYAEVADFLGEKVVPLYGPAVLPELRVKFDPKGTRGHPRRLRLMHALDPAGTRELVKQSLETGSKEVRVAAVGCLGAEDAPVLAEQAGAKAAEVRQAAYLALAKIDDPAATAVLAKALAGKDVEAAADAIKQGGTGRATALLVAEAESTRAGLPKLKDRKESGAAARRLCKLIWAFTRAADPTADALTRDLFARRAELMKVKGDDFSGADVVRAVIDRMADGPEPLRHELVRAHATLDADGLARAVQAALRTLPPADVYDLFAPYLLAAGDKKKGKEAAEKRDGVVEMLGGDSVYSYVHRSGDRPPPDPRWLDLAVTVGDLGLMHAAGRPGHPGAEAHLAAEFAAAFKKSATSDRVREMLTVMVELRHPAAADSLLAVGEKLFGKGVVYAFWMFRLIPDLPAAAIPRLEAFVPKLKGHNADQWLAAVAELRNKK
jgi:hypothetical protein